MNYKLRASLLLLSIMHGANVAAISMVYNFRIAQITKQPVFERPNNKPHRVIALLFDQFRKKRDGAYQNFIGELSSFIVDFNDYYFRADAAFAHIHESKNHTTTFSGTQTDDILFTAGRNFILDPKNEITLSGLFGIPTHKIYRLLHSEFGYNQIGLGAQLDGAYEFKKNNTFLYGTRYLYFVPRNAQDPLGLNYRFTVGNVTDILVAYKNNWDMQGLEFGYTARFRFGAHSSPKFDDIVKKTDYIRSNIYGVYKYKFFINTIPNRLLFNIAYGYDHTPKEFGSNYIVTLWASWSIGF